MFSFFENILSDSVFQQVLRVVIGAQQANFSNERTDKIINGGAFVPENEDVNIRILYLIRDAHFFLTKNVRILEKYILNFMHTSCTYFSGNYIFDILFFRKFTYFLK